MTHNSTSGSTSAKRIALALPVLGMATVFAWSMPAWSVGLAASDYIRTYGQASGGLVLLVADSGDRGAGQGPPTGTSPGSGRGSTGGTGKGGPGGTGPGSGMGSTGGTTQGTGNPGGSGDPGSVGSSRGSGGSGAGSGMGSGNTGSGMGSGSSGSGMGSGGGSSSGMGGGR